MGGARREAVCFTAPATCTLPEVAAVSPPLVTLTKMSSHYNTQFIIPSTNGALFHGIYQFAAPPLVQRAQLRRVSCCYLCALLTVFRRFRRFGCPSCAKRGNKRLCVAARYFSATFTARRALFLCRHAARSLLTSRAVSPARFCKRQEPSHAGAAGCRITGQSPARRRAGAAHEFIVGHYEFTDYTAPAGAGGAAHEYGAFAG